MKISIVTPSFNQATFLEQTIRSVLEQGYPDLEYIVMDGGSTDGSVEIVRRYAHRLTHWQSQGDDGQAAAILHGFARAGGDILGWVNSDDLLLPGCLKTVAEHFRSVAGEECAAGGAVFIDASGAPVRRALRLVHSRIGLQATFRMLLIAGCPFCQPATFWRREALVAVGGFDRALRFSFDYDLYLRFAQRQRIGHIPRLLAAVRLHEGTKTNTLGEVKEAEDTLLRSRFGLTRYPRPWRATLRAVYRARYSLTERAGWLKHSLGLVGPTLGEATCPEEQTKAGVKCGR